MTCDAKRASPERRKGHRMPSLFTHAPAQPRHQEEHKGCHKPERHEQHHDHCKPRKPKHCKHHHKSKKKHCR